MGALDPQKPRRKARRPRSRSLLMEMETADDEIDTSDRLLKPGTDARPLWHPEGKRNPYPIR